MKTIDDIRKRRYRCMRATGTICRHEIKKASADCKGCKWLFYDNDVDFLLSEIDRLKKYEKGIGAPTRRLLDEIDRLTSENERLRTERDAAVNAIDDVKHEAYEAGIKDGCRY